MRVKLVEFGASMRKGAIFTMRGCYRSVWNHPFLVFMVFAFLYSARSYSYMLSLLISASPVLLCTAALLGTLLFYGQQNIPETETEHKTRSDAVLLKKGLCNDACVENFSESKRGELEEESSLLVNKLAQICVGGKERSSAGSESENSESCELDVAIEEKKSEFNEERLVKEEAMEDHHAIISKVIGDLLGPESEKDSRSEDADSSDDGSDSGSDRVESSSPEPSMDEMMKILDELHPLLDEGAAKPELNEQSPWSSISSSVDSGEESEVQESENDQTKPFIAWTEEDEKNLMDIGSSEVERNQRLERILRRRKNMSMVEFENPEFQLKIPPISTLRRNPFDLPHEGSAPGSAPSIMSQRRNPFDLPYDEVDPDESQSRRSDDFLARPSIFAPKRQERHLSRLRPFFVPEETPAEESSFSPLQVQSSHETESVSSVAYQGGLEDGEMMDLKSYNQKRGEKYEF